MEAPNERKIAANTILPQGKAYMVHNGETVFTYTKLDAKGNNKGVFMINRAMFSAFAQGNQEFPPLISLSTRGSKVNACFIFMWIQKQPEMIKWISGMLPATGSWETIKWKPYEQIPGVKNKGLGNQANEYQQGIFEGSRRWVEFLETKDYKLMFPGDEIVGNQLYAMRSRNADILTSSFEVADAMLAQEYDEKRIRIPFYVQPKLDGKRCMIGLKEGRIISASRNRKMAKSIPHIDQQMMIVFQVMTVICAQSAGVEVKTINDSSYWFDGELYKHGMSFQKIISGVNRDAVSHNETTNTMDYAIYDLIDNGTLEQQHRLMLLSMIFDNPVVKQHCLNIKLVPTFTVNSFDEVTAIHASNKKAGYEGTMIRNINNKYQQGKRSYDLLKLKDFITEEWYICGAEQATGTQAGAVKWVLSNNQGMICRAVPVGPEIGTIESRRQQFANQHLFMGAVATIEFFSRHDGKDGENAAGAPRFPHVIAYNRKDHK